MEKACEEVIRLVVTEGDLSGPVSVVLCEPSQWRKHSRDLTADYQAAYGYAPGNVIGIALLTDTDNTNAETKAYYGDIELKYKNYKPN